MNIVVIDNLALIIGVFLLGAQVCLRSKLYKIVKYIAVISTIAVMAILIYYSIAQYILWKNVEISKGLLPPYRPISYFLFYALMRFWAQYGISFIFALIFGIASHILNNRFGKRFLEREEPYFIFFSIFLLGHPFWILYVVGFLFAAVIYAILRRIFGYEGRVPFYFLWITILIFILILKQPLLGVGFFGHNFFNLLKL